MKYSLERTKTMQR